MRTYHIIDEVFADRRKGVNLSVVFESLLRTPELWMPYGTTPFSAIQDLYEGDYLDTTSWVGLPIELQIQYAKDYKKWYLERLGLSTWEQIGYHNLRMTLIPPIRSLVSRTTNAWKPPFKKTPGFLPKPLWFGQTVVTERQWSVVMGNRYFPGDYPQNYLWFSECQDFCKRTETRLPTALEWQLACRAGTTTEYSFGDDPDLLGNHGWYAGNSQGHIQKVEQKKQNPFDLYDMHGNVWELTTDRIKRNKSFVTCGGSYASVDRVCTSHSQNFFLSTMRDFDVGFRVVAEFNPWHYSRGK